ncbi:GNAT family N-acetyltransferase [Flavisolibacter tropicus]|uniref:Acetyltransferase n=1 Tax=Flavisolibacter tropicus TaxID=1492898 RepID=A0A172TYU7_9BACT|nr:GNAT family N-acetyltransferase [Flavisolibacter tropicus]ANE51963.1 acetyltransferase [Flavisolibacter tropicus]
MHIKRINHTEHHLVVDLFDQYRVFYNQPSDKKLADNYILQRLENNESAIFVALENVDGNVVPVGFTQLYPTYSSVRAVKNWILNDLYVDADHRKKGIGEKLIQAAMEFAKADNATYVQLETATDNHNAQRLYETIGFVKQQPEEGFFVYRITL